MGLDQCLRVAARLRPAARPWTNTGILTLRFRRADWKRMDMAAMQRCRQKRIGIAGRNCRGDINRAIYAACRTRNEASVNNGNPWLYCFSLQNARLDRFAISSKVGQGWQPLEVNLAAFNLYCYDYGTLRIASRHAEIIHVNTVQILYITLLPRHERKSPVCWRHVSNVPG